MKTTVDAVEGDEIHYSGEYTGVRMEAEPDVNPLMRQQMERSMQALEGATFSGRVTDRGVPLAMEIDMPGELDAQLIQMMDSIQQGMEQWGMLLPEEPVGVGAVWHAEIEAESVGITSHVTSQYRLRELDGDVMILDVETRTLAEDQPIEMPAEAAGAEAHLVRMEGEGRGWSRFDLGRLNPLESAMDADFDQEMQITVFDEQMLMQQVLQMQMEFQAVED